MYPTTHVQAASREDALWLAPRLREADLQEIRANSGREPLAVLLDGLERSTPAYAVIDRGETIAMFGACPLPFPSVGLVWMLASPRLPQLRTRFLRGCREWLDHLHAQYPALVSFVDARNSVHLRWLDWCGFNIVRTHPAFGVEQRAFHEVFRTTRYV